MNNKIYIVHLFLGLFLNIKINAQNLVLNPSFEIYTACPNAGGQINFATPWIGTSGGVDYYNSCGTIYYNVPYQTGGNYQPARTGNSYAGLYMTNSFGGDYREYLEVPLTDSLENGQCYYASFYVNLLNKIDLAVNNFGLYISNNSFTTGTPWGIAPYTPQILSFKNKIINDTLNWIKISGVYNAGGGEKFIAIGNFYSDLNTDTIHTGESVYDGAYYYIDDVSVIPIDSMPGGMPANAGNDTSVVLGDSVFIGQQISNLNCNWYDSSGTLIASNLSGIYVHPTGTTHYVVEQNLCGTITYDTVNVNVTHVGINENSWNKKINIYPNPNEGEFTIELPNENVSREINISDMQGRSIFKETSNSHLLTLKPDAENGVYLVHITNLITNETVIKKLVIQH